MLPRSHAHQPTRRLSAVGPPQLCAIAAALLLLSLFVLHSRLSSSPLSTPSLPTAIATEPESKPESDTRRASSTPNLSLDLIDELDIVESDSDSKPGSKSKTALVWDHILGVARLPFGSVTSDPDSDSDPLKK